MRMTGHGQADPGCWGAAARHTRDRESLCVRRGLTALRVQRSAWRVRVSGDLLDCSPGEYPVAESRGNKMIADRVLVVECPSNEGVRASRAPTLEKDGFSYTFKTSLVSFPNLADAYQA